METCALERGDEVVLNLKEREEVTVLHIDDEREFLQTAKRCLELEEGFSVYSASSVEEALERMKEQDFDVIVSDYMMPSKNGLEFLRELRENGNETPFIVLTGKGREEVAIKALNLGADQYLSKSGSPKAVYGELVHSIRQAVKRRRAEEKVIRSEELMRSLFNAAVDGIAYVDPSGKILAANKRLVEEMLGYEIEDTIGRDFTKLGRIESSDRPHVLNAMREVITSGQPIEHFEVTLIGQDGSRIPTEISTGVSRENGVVTGITAVVRDISERKKTEKAVRENQEKFQKLFVHSPEAAVYVDSNYKITDINPRFSDLFGYSLNEIRGREIDDVVVPEGKEEEGKMLGRRASEGYVYFDTVRRRKDGTLVHVSISAAPITIGGQLVGHVGLYKDITAQKKAERELEEARTHFQTLFNLMVDPVAIVDKKGRILDTTKSAVEATGFKKEELIGKNFLRTRIATTKSKALLVKNLAKRMMGMHMAPYEVEMLTKDGRKLLYEVNALKIEYKGKPADLVVFRDVSERKKMEEKLRVVGKLTRHDVRNKLSVITGNAFLARNKVDNPETLGYLEDIEFACQQIEGIFDFARAYERLGVEKSSYMNVERTFSEAAALFPNLSGIEVIRNCPQLTVLADSLLRQVFYNLIDNSIRYGERVSQIQMYCAERADEIELIYEDNGIGVADTEKEKIFAEGYGKGTGYGLYLIKKVCGVYGWTIEETGEEGKGAQFTMTIPKNSEKGAEGYRLRS